MLESGDDEIRSPLDALLNLLAFGDAVLLQKSPSQPTGVSEDLQRVMGCGKAGVLLGLQSSDHFRTPVDVDFFSASASAVNQA